MKRPYGEETEKKQNLCRNPQAWLENNSIKVFLCWSSIPFLHATSYSFFESMAVFNGAELSLATTITAEGFWQTAKVCCLPPKPGEGRFVRIQRIGIVSGIKKNRNKKIWESEGLRRFVECPCAGHLSLQLVFKRGKNRCTKLKKVNGESSPVKFCMYTIQSTKTLTYKNIRKVLQDRIYILVK